MSEPKDLVQIMRDNPGARAVIDNDSWKFVKDEDYPEDLDDWSYDAQERWENEHVLAESGNVLPLGDGGYGSGNIHGGDILQALAVIVGIKIESV